jgi:hypothetical protein
MTTTETMQMPALGEQGELCGGCGAPLAADQRYCLNCGQRRCGPRVDYRRYLMPEAVEASPAPTASEAAGTAAAVTPEQQAPAGRDYTPLAAVGGIALLGLMLLVGVLIGKGNNSTAPAPPQIVRLGSEAGSGESAPAAAAPRVGGGSSHAKQAPKSTGGKAVEGGLTGQAAQQSDATVQASKNDLQALNEQSGESYEETVKKLPDKIATPGAPPPIDKTKAPGGGGGAQTIE